MMRLFQKYSNYIPLALIVIPFLNLAVLWVLAEVVLPRLVLNKGDMLYLLLYDYGQQTSYLAVFIAVGLPLSAATLWLHYKSAIEEVSPVDKNVIVQHLWACIASLVILFLVVIVSFWKLAPVIFALLITLSSLLGSIGVSAIINRVSLIAIKNNPHMGRGAFLSGILFLVMALAVLIRAAEFR